MSQKADAAPSLNGPELVLAERLESVAILTLNRPEVLNSFNTVCSQQFLAALTSVANDPSVRAIVLTGSGRAFCAGQDLTDIDTQGDLSAQIRHIVHTQWNPIVETIANLPKPIIAAVNGIAAGAGASLALCCDFVLAAKEAAFMQAFCKIGLIPDTAGTFFLPRLVGLQKARELCLLGEKISSEDALRCGLIYKVTDAAALPGEAAALAKQLAAAPTKAIALTKLALAQSFEHTLSQQLALEEQLQAQAAASGDFREGLAAFSEKRKPNFTGS